MEGHESDTVPQFSSPVQAFIWSMSLFLTLSQGRGITLRTLKVNIMKKMVIKIILPIDLALGMQRKGNGIVSQLKDTEKCHSHQSEHHNWAPPGPILLHNCDVFALLRNRPRKTSNTIQNDQNQRFGDQTKIACFKLTKRLIRILCG